MISNVNSLNGVLNIKAASFGTKFKANDDIEVFSSDQKSSNTSQNDVLSQNCEISPEEKTNKGKKWLIGLGIALGVTAIGVISYGIFKKTPKAILNTNFSDAKPQLTSLMDDMTNFLKTNKGKHVSSDDIVNIFKKHYPDIKLDVIDERPFGSLFSGAVASSNAKLPKDLSNDVSYSMHLRSKSFLDKLKSFLHLKNKNKEFYVTNSFAENLLHESTHISQHITKPTQLAYQRTLTSSLPKDSNWVFGFNFDNAFTYNDLVYKEEFFFNKNKYIKKLMKRIRAPYYMENKEKEVAIQLKQLIREAQAEKQAYEIGKLNQLRYRFPKLTQNSKIDNFFQKVAKKYADVFKWGSKIEVMKKEYFNLIQNLRQSYRA